MYVPNNDKGLHLMKCLAQTQGEKIRVNAVLPGLLLTDWVSCFLVVPDILPAIVRRFGGKMTSKLRYK